MPGFISIPMRVEEVEGKGREGEEDEKRRAGNEPGELFAQAADAVGDLLVDTSRLLRVDFASAEFLLQGVDT